MAKKPAGDKYKKNLKKLEGSSIEDGGLNPEYLWKLRKKIVPRPRPGVWWKIQNEYYLQITFGPFAEISRWKTKSGE